jgi:F-type H+-transporting ATPase subunit delta
MYAHALFDAAKEQGRLAAVREELHDLALAVDEVPELGAVLENPEIDQIVKAQILGELVGGGEELTRNFLRLLAEKGRAAELVQVAREYETLVAAEEGVLQVELTTAFELSDKDAAGIVRQIEQASGRTVEATRSVDPKLIGGIVLQAGSMRVDASVHGRLERLRQDLATVRS